jgi:hypothetical protein
MVGGLDFPFYAIESIKLTHTNSMELRDLFAHAGNLVERTGVYGDIYLGNKVPSRFNAFDGYVVKKYPWEEYEFSRLKLGFENQFWDKGVVLDSENFRNYAIELRGKIQTIAPHITRLEFAISYDSSQDGWTVMSRLNTGLVRLV